MAKTRRRVKGDRTALRAGSGIDVASLVGGLALALVVPVLAAAGFPLSRLGLAVFVVYVPMVVAQHHFMPRVLSGVPMALTIAGTAWWGVSAAIPSDSAGGLRVAALALGVLLLAIGVLDRWLMERTAYRYFVLAVPLVWTTLLFGMSSGPTGTIGWPAHSLFGHPSLIQPVSVVGAVGLNLLIFLVNYGVASAVLTLLRHPSFPARRGVRVGAAVAGAAVVWTVSSVLMLEEPPPAVRVAAYQPGVGASAMNPEQALAIYEEATRSAADQGAELVVWPEYGLRYDPLDTGTELLVDLATDAGTHIAVGYGLPTGTGGSRNEAVLFTPDGRILGPYAKQHPVRVLGERSDTDYGYPVFDTAIGDLALLICYDLDYLDTPREMARNGAGLVAVPSLDWSEIAEMHYTGFVLRAVENRLTIVKADAAWDSAIIDPYGRVLSKEVSPHGSEALLVADVPLGSGSSPMVSMGNATGLMTAAGALLVVVLIAAQSRRRRAVTPRS